LIQNGVESRGIDTNKGENFFDWDGYVDLIMGNPPYSIAQRFIEHALPRCGTLIFLLRLNFLGSLKRKEFWNQNKPDTLFVLSKRPSFRMTGTDMTEYAWYVWQNEAKHIDQGIHHINP
jgi:hypothetical protein